jgi:hypothetical protein
LSPFRTIHHSNDTLPELEGNVHHNKAIGAGVFGGFFPAVFPVALVSDAGIEIIADFMADNAGHGLLFRKVDVLADTGLLRGKDRGHRVDGGKHAAEKIAGMTGQFHRRVKFFIIDFITGI